jgi:hypothetical protein
MLCQSKKDGRGVGCVEMDSAALVAFYFEVPEGLKITLLCEVHTCLSKLNSIQVDHNKSAFYRLAQYA